MMKTFKVIEPLVLAPLLFFAVAHVCLKTNGGEFNGQPIKGQMLTPKDWVIFSPPDRSFSINLPQMPSLTEKFNPGAKDELQNFRCTNSLVAAYKFPLRPDTKEFEFAIGVFDVSRCKRTPRDFRLETERIVRLFADDPNDAIISDKAIKVNRYPGRELITRTGAGNDVWDMFVDTGQRMYWLAYSTDEHNGHLSREASLIFRSSSPKR
jgi:hypothetical protein